MMDLKLAAHRTLASLLALAAFTQLAPGTTPAEAASGVRFFELDSQQQFLEGTLEGIALDPLGTLSLADRAERVAELGEPFLLSAVAHPEGWVVGTGNDGKVLLVGRDGTTSTLFEAPEPEIFAVAVASDGSVLAGTSPDGKVYSIRKGSSSVLFDPQQKYIWALLPRPDGSVLVATGTDGKLFRVSKSGETETVFDSEDTHLRSLKALGGGDVLIGTAGEGLVLRMSPQGQVRTIYDAAQPEVVAFAESPGGTCYVAVLASEASQVDLSARPGVAQSTGASGGAQSSAGGQVTVTVTPDPAQAATAAAGTRPPGFQGPRSEILSIGAEGSVATVWSFDTETVYSLSWQAGRLWVGTGLDGKVFSFRDGHMVLEKDLTERQVIAVLTDRDGPVYATTNAAALFRAVGEPEREGTFISPVLDASQTSDFGTLSWVGSQPKGTRAAFSARTGMSAHPDRTWSEWSAEQTGDQVVLGELPTGRYLQWRARLESGNGESPTLSRIAISYRQRNLPPRIKKLEVLSPGEVIVPPGFVPGSQTFEPSRPDKDGFFSTLESAKSDRDRQRKTLYKQGFRTVSWEAEDPNGDDLEYALYFRRDRSEMSWLPMGEPTADDFFSFDATALPDGVYRFKLEVYDRDEKSGDAPLRSERVSEPAYVDHTPPSVERTRVEAGVLHVELSDVMSPLSEAEFSIDAGEWTPARVQDGLLDSTKETLSIELPEAGESQLLLLRAMDRAFNVVTFDLTSQLP